MTRSFVTLLLVAVALFAAACGEDGPGPSLSERANAACGTDRIVSFKHEPETTWQIESIAITCKRPDGTIYRSLLEADR